MNKQVFSMDFYGKNLSVEVGELAKQANGAVLVRYNDIVISDESYKQGDYLVQVNYRLLKDLTVEGTVSI